MNQVFRYLRAIGFSEDGMDIKKIVREIIKSPTQYHEFEDENDFKRVEYYKEFGEGFGLIVRGEKDEDSWLNIVSMSPCAQGGSNIDCYEIEMLDEEGETGSALCEEQHNGTLFSFYLQNLSDWYALTDEDKEEYSSASLSGFSIDGMVIFPVSSEEDNKQKALKESMVNTGLLERARNGDEMAADQLTNNAKELTKYLYERIQKEEMLTVLREYFYPLSEMEDIYAVLGEIKEVKILTNVLTSKSFYCLDVEAMGIRANIYINREDLVGLPTAGMRFKGEVWLHGSLA